MPTAEKRGDGFALAAAAGRCRKKAARELRAVGSIRPIPRLLGMLLHWTFKWNDVFFMVLV